MSDWDEIRRLAADFQRAQTVGASQKLSERNCIEIVSKLIELKLIDVVYTCDGKEYLTPQQLQREMADELYVSGGRISLVDISTALNVDFSQVETTASQVAQNDDDIHLVLGQLVTCQYLDDLAREVNDKLQQKGSINIPSLTKELDLPTEYLVEEFSKRVGSIIEGFKDEFDPKVIMTSSFIARNRAKIRGVLSAVTVPTSCSSIVNRFGLDEKLFFTLADELIRTRRLPGSITGGRTLSKASYVPHSYAKSQTSWIDNFYASNGYLEYDSIIRLGISDPLQYLKKKYKDEKLVFLGTCCLGPSVIEQITTSMDEALGSGSWIDLLPLLPSVLSQEDESELVQQLLHGRSDVLVLGTSTLLSMRLVDMVKEGFQADMEPKAKQDIESGAVVQSLVDVSRGSKLKEDEDKSDKKEERRKKAAGGKAGGGAQGRETKTKSTKKKGGKRRTGDDDWADDSDDEGRAGGGGPNMAAARGGGGVDKAAKRKELEFKSVDELKDWLTVHPPLADCPEEVFEQLALHLQDGLNRSYREVAMRAYQATLAASLHNKRRTHSDLQEKVNTLYTSFRLSVKGVEEFHSEEHKSALSKYLLKSAGCEILTEIFLYIAEENMIKMEDCKELTVENRVKIIKDLPSQVAEPAMRLHKAVLGQSAEEFLRLLETDLMELCDVMLKKADKKKDRQIIFSHRHQLLDQMSQCHDPALCLHLAALIIFQHQTGCILQASGRNVPTILSFLKDSLSEEQNSLLASHQALVIAHLKDPQENTTKLDESMQTVKALVEGLKKTTSE